MSDFSRVMMTQRMMAWEKAKGELRGILYTFWAVTKDEFAEYEKHSDAIKGFIKKMDEEIIG